LIFNISFAVDEPFAASFRQLIRKLMKKAGGCACGDKG